VNRVASIVVAGVAAFLSILAIAFLLGNDPAQAATIVARGSFGSWYAIGETLLKATPLIFTALAVVIAFRGGLWNIGAEGQFLAGAIAGTGCSLVLPSSSLSSVIAICAGVAGGAAWAAIAALLKIRRGVPEVLSTILLNFLAVFLLGWLVTGPMQEGNAQYPQSEAIAEASRLVPVGATRLHAGFAIAVACAIALAWLLRRTRFGLLVRAIGANRPAARWAGVDIDMIALQAMLLSGGLAGAGGAVEVLGVTHRLFERFAAGYGYTAIAVALLAALHPLGTIVASIFFAAIVTGSGELQRSIGMPSSVAVVAQGIAIVLVAALSRIDLPRFAGTSADAEEMR
jgi:general nucleoside transport system permease protein